MVSFMCYNVVVVIPFLEIKSIVVHIIVITIIIVTMVITEVLGSQ